MLRDSMIQPSLPLLYHLLGSWYVSGIMLISHGAPSSVVPSGKAWTGRNHSLIEDEDNRLSLLDGSRKDFTTISRSRRELYCPPAGLLASVRSRSYTVGNQFRLKEYTTLQSMIAHRYISPS